VFGKDIIRRYSALIACWWRSADERSIATLISLTLVAAGVWTVVVVLLDLDSFSTLRTNTEFAICVKITAASVAGLLFARSYFGPSDAVIARYPAWSSLRRKTADWVLRGCAVTAFFTAAFWYLSSQAVGIVAQHVGGSTVTYHGNVISVSRSTGPRAKCRIEMAIRTHPGLTKLQFCLVIWGGTPLGPLDLGPPDSVVIHTRINVLGETVDSVNYDDEAGE
jgi:hypothetical protein